MKHGEAEKARLLGLAGEYILRHGVGDLTITKLSREIGSNNRMLLYYFGSFPDLVADASRHVLRRFPRVGAMREIILESDPIDARLRRAWRELAHEDNFAFHSLFFEIFARSSRDPAESRRHLDRVAFEWTEAVTAALRDEFGAEARTTAIGIVAVWRGLEVLLLAGESREDLAVAHDAAIAALLDAARARGGAAAL